MELDGADSADQTLRARTGQKYTREGFLVGLRSDEVAIDHNDWWTLKDS